MTNSCVFRLRKEGEAIMIVCLHVDDNIIVNKDILMCPIRFIFFYYFKQCKETFCGI